MKSYLKFTSIFCIKSVWKRLSNSIAYKKFYAQFIHVRVSLLRCYYLLKYSILYCKIIIKNFSLVVKIGTSVKKRSNEKVFFEIFLFYFILLYKNKSLQHLIHWPNSVLSTYSSCLTDIRQKKYNYLYNISHPATGLHPTYRKYLSVSQGAN